MVSGRCHRWSWEGVWSVAVAATTSGAAGFIGFGATIRMWDFH